MPPNSKLLYSPGVSTKYIKQVDLVVVADIHGIATAPTADELMCWLQVIAHGKPVVDRDRLSRDTRPWGAECFLHKPALKVSAEIGLSPRFVRKHPYACTALQECAECKDSNWRVVHLPDGVLPSALPAPPKGTQAFTWDFLGCLQQLLLLSGGL